LIGAVAGVAPLAYLAIYAQWKNQPTRWFIGDYITSTGLNAGKLAVGSRMAAIPSSVWVLLQVLAIASTVVAAALAGEGVALRLSVSRRHAGRIDPVRTLASGHLVATAASMVVAARVNGALFDRYLWPAVATGAVLVCLAGTRPVSAKLSSIEGPPVRTARGHPRLGLAPMLRAAPFALLAVVSVLFAVNSDAYDGARWAAASAATNASTPATSVDAGPEWIGAHATTIANYALVSAAGDRSWWLQMFRLDRPCVVVASSPVAPSGYELASTRSFRTWLIAGQAHLWVYRDSAGTCLPATR
jgi:hypothetical protein